jgi:RecJ-like exonuclease
MPIRPRLVDRTQPRCSNCHGYGRVGADPNEMRASTVEAYRHWLAHSTPCPRCKGTGVEKIRRDLPKTS